MQLQALTPSSFDAVVLADGDYPTHPLPLSVLHEARFVACCDGATNLYVQHRGCPPQIIVGDGDSLTPENRRLYAHLLHRITEQESNDLTKTVTRLASLGYRRIAILGATGKREDHTLGNISLLIEYMRQGLEVVMLTDHGVFLPFSGEASIGGKDAVAMGEGGEKENTTGMLLRPGQQLSIFNFTAGKMHAQGLRYPIRPFTSWWQGTLNECEGNSITIHADGEYLVYINY